MFNLPHCGGGGARSKNLLICVTSFMNGPLKLSNVAADITLQTSNTLGDGTQCVLSMGSFGNDNNQILNNISKHNTY